MIAISEDVAKVMITSFTTGQTGGIPIIRTGDEEWQTRDKVVEVSQQQLTKRAKTLHYDVGLAEKVTETAKKNLQKLLDELEKVQSISNP